MRSRRSLSFRATDSDSRIATFAARNGYAGLFENGTRVSLDDSFEGGGIWRSCHPGEEPGFGDPLAAGLGRRATTDAPIPGIEPPAPSSEPVEEPASPPFAEPVDAPLDDDDGLGTGRLLRIGDSEISRRMPLRLAHLIEGYLPLRPIVADELRQLGQHQALVRLELTPRVSSRPPSGKHVPLP